jgi:hypothetical protein
MLYFCGAPYLVRHRNNFCGALLASAPQNIIPSIRAFLLVNEHSLFLVLRLDFIFCLDFCSELVISLKQGVFRPLVYVGFHL